MELNIDGKFEGKLKCDFQSYLRSLKKFHQRT